MLNVHCWKQGLLTLSSKKGAFVINFFKELKGTINYLANIDEQVQENDLLEQIFNSFPKNYESLMSTLIYHLNSLPTFGELIGILLHDETKKEIMGKKVKNENLFFKTRFNKAKIHGHKKNWKISGAKWKGGYNHLNYCTLICENVFYQVSFMSLLHFNFQIYNHSHYGQVYLLPK